MEQLVDKPTRGTNILDLVFSTQPSLFSECNSEPIDAISDHNLISFGMTCNPTSDADYVCSADVPEISKFNLKDANRPKLQQALNNTDWDTVLGGPDEIQNANTNFVQAITNAATLAGVPHFKTKSKNVMDKKVDKLIKEKEVKLSQMLSPTLRDKDKEKILQSINNINLLVNNLTVTIQEEKENRAIKNIRKTTPSPSSNMLLT